MLTVPQQRSLIAFYLYRDNDSINGNAFNGLRKLGLVAHGNGKIVMTSLGLDTAINYLETRIDLARLEDAQRANGDA